MGNWTLTRCIFFATDAFAARGKGRVSYVRLKFKLETARSFAHHKPLLPPAASAWCQIYLGVSVRSFVCLPVHTFSAPIGIGRRVFPPATDRYLVIRMAVVPCFVRVRRANRTDYDNRNGGICAVLAEDGEEAIHRRRQNAAAYRTTDGHSPAEGSWKVCQGKSGWNELILFELLVALCQLRIETTW